MKIDPIETITGIVVTEVERLDPVTVIFRDIEPGKGYLIVACYNQAWTTYWGGMSGKSVREFVAGCDAGYLASNITWNLKTTKPKLAYVRRIAQAVIDACKAA